MSKQMRRAAYQNGEKLVGTFRRFPFGPVYQVLAIRTEGARTVADIELPESGEKVTLPVEQILESPKAE